MSSTATDTLVEADALGTVEAATERLADALGVSIADIEHDTGYRSAEEHLYDHLVALSLRLKRYILLYWQRMVDRSGTLNDAIVSVDEMMRFFGRGEVSAPDVETNIAAIEREMEVWHERRTARAAATSDDVFLPLNELRRAFALNDLELELLVAGAAPELDVGFGRIYRYAWADFAQRRPTVFFVSELLATNRDERREIRRRLQPSAPLRHFQLLVLELQGGAVEASRSTAAVSVPNRVLSFLLGDREPDEEFLSFMNLYRTGPLVDDLIMEEKAKGHVRRALQTAGHQGAKLVLTGPEGVGKVSLVRALAMERRKPVIKVDLLRLHESASRARQQLGAAVREAILQQADLVLDDSGVFSEEEDVGNLLEPIMETIGQCTTPTYFVTDGSPMWLHGRRNDIVEIELGIAPPPGQRELWRRQFEGPVQLASHVDLSELVQRYSLSAGSIHRAAGEAIRLAELREGETTVTFVDLLTAIRHQFHHRLGALAQPISTNLQWDDVVLPPDLIERIREIIAFAKHREHVYDRWGFRRKMSYGRGLSCLFSGAPGTGKTMMVCIIAKELGRELFRVDVSRVVDKYIGETEKNLAKVFEEAERSQAIILFDEADSLFAKRTEVKSSHDRYANLEVNYLLQRMEEFDGATFLTTNFETSIDEAFERRLRFKLTFPMPDFEERVRLWSSMFPEEAEVSDDIDWHGLADAFEMSGGLIKNAVLRAAFYAAEDGTEINHEILYRAALTELRDAGHVIRDDIHRKW